MTEFISEVFSTIFGDNVILATILIAIVPIIEIKGAIPFAMSPAFWGELALSAQQALLFSLIGSCLIVPILALIYLPIINALKRTKLFKSIALKIEEKVNKNKNRIELRAEKTTQKDSRNSALQEDTTGTDNIGEIDNKNIDNSNLTISQDNINKTSEERETKTKFDKIFFIKLISVFLFVSVPLPLTGVWTGTCVAVMLGLGFGWTCLSVISGNIVAGLLVMLVSSIPGFDSSYIVYAVIVFILVMVLIWVIKSLVKKKKTK